MSAWTDRAWRSFAASFINGSHRELAAWARRHFAHEGRGVIAITVRGEMPTVPDLREIRVGYLPVAEYRRLTASAVGPTRAGVDYTIMQIQSYRPELEAVFVCVAGPQFLTTVFVVPLDTSTPVSDAHVVH